MPCGGGSHWIAFRSLRERAMAQARARGIYTDEDVFKIVS